jgi:hypothetical protein
MQFPQKVRKDTLRRTCAFPSIVICGSRSAFWCVRYMKCRRTIFHARVGLVRFPQTRTETPNTELVFLHPVGSVGEILHSIVTRLQKSRCTIFHARVGLVRIPQIAL